MCGSLLKWTKVEPGPRPWEKRGAETEKLKASGEVVREGAVVAKAGWGNGGTTAGFLEQGLLACSLAVSCPGPDVGSCLNAVRGSRAVPLHFPRVCTFANLFWKSLGSGAGQGLGCSSRLESNFNESELETPFLSNMSGGGGDVQSSRPPSNDRFLCS